MAANSSSGMKSIESLAHFKRKPHLFFMYAVEEPLFVLLGIVSNIWIVVVLVRKSVRLSKTSKFYYTFFSLADLFICFTHLLWNIPCDTLSIYSKDNLFFCIDTWTNLSCTLIFIAYTVGEIMANYSIVALSI